MCEETLSVISSIVNDFKQKFKTFLIPIKISQLNIKDLKDEEVKSLSQIQASNANYEISKASIIIKTVDIMRNEVIGQFKQFTKDQSNDDSFEIG